MTTRRGTLRHALKLSSADIQTLSSAIEDTERNEGKEETTRDSDLQSASRDSCESTQHVKALHKRQSSPSLSVIVERRPISKQQSVVHLARETVSSPKPKRNQPNESKQPTYIKNNVLFTAVEVPQRIVCFCSLCPRSLLIVFQCDFSNFDQYMHEYLRTIRQGSHKTSLLERLYPSLSPKGTVFTFICCIFSKYLCVELRALKKTVVHPDADEQRESALEDLHLIWDEIISDSENLATLRRTSTNTKGIKGGCFRDLLYAITGKDSCSVFHVFTTYVN